MINTSKSSSFATFIAIVGVLLMPLSKVGGIYAWPCGRIAVSVCFFYIGCLGAEWLKGRLSRKWLVTIGVAAVICFGQKYVFESASQLPNRDHLYWCYWHISFISWFSWFVYYMSFAFLGIIINSPLSVPLKRFAGGGPEDAMLMAYPFGSGKERFWKDFISGVVCFVLYMVMSILPYVTEFYTTAPKALIVTIRILLVIPWVATLIYVYRCVMSEKIAALTNRLPKLTMAITSLCPGAIMLTLTNYANQWSIVAFLSLPIMAYILSVLWRFALRFLIGLCKMLVSKEFGWKEILVGNAYDING